MIEEWRPIPGYEGLYEASSLGNVRNTRGHVLSIRNVTDWGYRQIHLFRQGEGSKTFKVHRLVCLAFHPQIEGKTHVNHINGDKLDNRAENLEWLSKRENEEHAGTLGRHHAATNPKRGWKLSTDNVIDIRRRWNDGQRICEIARDYPQCNQNYIAKVCKGFKRSAG